MGTETAERTAEKELGAMKWEMDKLAECCEELGDDIDSAAVAGILRSLMDGATAQYIIYTYALIEEGA